MPKVGDRIVVEGSKVGGARREGTLKKLVGSMIQVRWTDGSETLFSPGAGTVQYLPSNGKHAKVEKSAKKTVKPASKPKAIAKPAPAKGKDKAKTKGKGKKKR